MDDRIHRVLAPRSIAVIGASKDGTKRGYQSIASLLASGFPGEIYPINPRVDEVCGLRAYGSISEITPPPDLAVIATPASTVPALVRECGSAGVSGVCVFAVGFRESDATGKELERELLSVAQLAGVRVLGPNTSGLINAAIKVNLVGLQDVPEGHLAVISQSGNLLPGLLLQAQAVGEGLSFYVGPGNQTDLAFADYLRYVADDEASGAIVMYAEGLDDGRATLGAIRRAVERKPVVVLRGGRSDAGRLAALSHTGSLARSPHVADDLLRQAGAYVVARSDELLPAAHALLRCPTPRGNRIALLVDGGGHGTIATDAVAASPMLQLARLSSQTNRRLRATLPPAAPTGNPVDVAGATDRDPGLFIPVLEALFEDDGVDLVVLAGIFGGYGIRFHPDLQAEEIRAANRMVTMVGAYQKPLLVAATYADVNPAPLQRLRAGRIPVFASIEAVVSSAAAVADHARFRRSMRERSRFAALSPITEPEPGARALTEPAARAKLAEFGVQPGPWGLATSAAEAQSLADALGTPLALKIVSRDILHKSDAGGVRLSVARDSVAQSYRELVATVSERVPDASIDGVLMSPMAPPGVELLIGLTREPQFGPVLALGAGGVLVEHLEQLTFRSAPVSRLEAEEMTREGLVGELLSRPRGIRRVNTDALVELLVRVSVLAVEDPELLELDLNPVIVHESGCAIVDARAVVASEAGRSESLLPRPATVIG